jgi:hypothetical protein
MLSFRVSRKTQETVSDVRYELKTTLFYLGEHCEGLSMYVVLFMLLDVNHAQI